ncbi:benzyl alcohol O-benzoyltransferase [Manihot esculenta]|uniref:benzyl alcohol O-benzoyltransferase n=1 Tax=Manihot esculenta TaxID=3983 RepID=UPI001CC4C891|nr:benzyl alcohol O-benzoyltransferase [Manihot esculenta]
MNQHKQRHQKIQIDQPCHLYQSPLCSRSTGVNLSSSDDQDSLRFQIPILQVYRHHPSMQIKDPVKVIGEALAKALVFYYPFAGRLREGPNRKLLVEHTAEGILFTEADVDVTLEQFGDALIMYVENSILLYYEKAIMATDLHVVTTTKEYIQSVADLMVIKGRPHFYSEVVYTISDVRHIGFREVDFGWGKAICGGPVKSIPRGVSYYVPFENKGENGIVFPICLPAQATERFAKELRNLLEGS